MSPGPWSSDELRLLEAVLLGELGADAPAVRAAAAASPAFARELGELLGVRGALERAGAQERDALAEPSAPSDRRVRDAAMARFAASRRRRWGPRSWLVVAAALLALLVLVPPLVRRDAADDIPLAGDFRVEVERGYAAVRWDCPLPPGWTFRVEVRDPAAARSASPIAAATVTDAQWRPDDPSAWPDAVVVEVRQLDQSGDTRRTGTWRARRDGR
ncbi:MAG: hypothetical protein AB7O97_07905 [Planctomycetota bacterium]